MKTENIILVGIGAGVTALAMRGKAARVGAIYKEIPNEFYPCVDGTYSDHNRNRACTRHGGLITDEAIRLCNGVELEGSELQVLSISVKDIQLYLKKFQNRETPYSEESVQRILNAVKDGTFRFEEFDPVLLWKAPDGILYMLSGHSRLEAFTRLSKQGNTRFNKIPAKIVAVPQAEAEEIALRSNTLSTKEKDYERAMFYRREIEIGKSYAKIIEAAKKNEGKDAPRIVAYAYLNPYGKTFTALKSLEGRDSNSDLIMRTIAYWVGEARLKFPQLSNMHEDEIYTWLVNGAYPKQYKNKIDFLRKIQQTIYQRTEFGNFDTEKPLNLLNTAVRSFSEERYIEEEELLKLKIKEQVELIERKAQNLRSNGAGSDQILQLLTNDYGYLNRLRVELTAWQQKKASIVNQGANAPSLFAISGVRRNTLKNSVGFL
jgi:hypothetical protein